MGKQSDLQSLTLLGMINSSLITLDQADMVPALKPTLAYGSQRMDELIRSFPIRWNEKEGWWTDVLGQIRHRINDRSDSTYTANAIAFFGVIICNDLLEELTDPTKREMVSEAMEILKAVDDHLDPAGDQIDTYHEVESIVNDIYAVVGFTREGRYLKHKRKLERRAKRNGRL